MANLTEKSLGIFWLVEDKNTKLLKSVNGINEVDGVISYGYWKGLPPRRKPSFPIWVWPKKTLFAEHEFYGMNWFVLRWDIRIYNWPHKNVWQKTLKNTLERMIMHGALVGWFGVEGNFIEPPYLFDPIEMPPGGVYACYTKNYGFKCTAKLGEEYKGFNEDDFNRLKLIIY